ncbi:MAG TPA: rhomboid family intramembrane serine protease [Vicinamibacterales bacterium]|nr:rhomboid family intramembrane serine protease [Vicinamibacterales bacterium]
MLPIRDVIPSHGIPVATLTLLLINALVFAVQLMADAVIVVAWPASLFMHTGVAHFVVNAVFLWLFGENVEARMGRPRFVLFYILCGIAAALVHGWLGAEGRAPIVGASGAIGGVIGAYLVLYPRSRVLMFVPLPLSLVEVPAVAFVGMWFVLQFAITAAVVHALGLDVSGAALLISHLVAFASGGVLCLAFRRPVVWT